MLPDVARDPQPFWLVFPGTEAEPIGVVGVHERGNIMLKVFIQKLERVVILHLQGRIVAGNRIKVVRIDDVKTREVSTIVLDFHRVERIDASGLGALVTLRHWAETNGIQLKLMNVAVRVKQIFELTKLNRILEYCSIEDMCMMLLHIPGNSEQPLAQCESNCI